MPGQAKKMIDKLIDQIAKGNPVIQNTTKTKLILKGIDADKYTVSSEDDPEVISKIKNVAAEFGVTL